MKEYKRNEDKGGMEVREASLGFPAYAAITLLSESPLYAHASIMKGITYDVFDQLQSKLDISEEKWAEILCLSVKSLQRYKKEKDFRFKPIHTEKILEISEVVALGMRVFEDNISHFNTWLATESFILGNHSPIDLISDSYGKEMVMQELTNIEQGIFI